MQVSILKTIQKVPGGIMLVPLLLGAVTNTFFPDSLNLGSFTTALFSKAGISTLIGLNFFCIGTQMRAVTAPIALKRGFNILFVKLFIGAAVTWIISRIWGLNGVFGIASVAFLSAIVNNNGGLYIALMSSGFGDNEDVAAGGVLQINDGPFLEMMVLGIAGLASIPFTALFAAIFPLLLGVLLGNIDKDFRHFFQNGSACVIPLMGFSLGASINLLSILSAGWGGVILGIVVLLCGIPVIIADRVICKRPGYAGAAASSAAGNSIATPAAIALADPTYLPFVEASTLQIAGAVIITAIGTPILTSYIASKYGKAQDSIQLSENELIDIRNAG